jgi:hypothetical protein
MEQHETKEKEEDKRGFAELGQKAEALIYELTSVHSVSFGIPQLPIIIIPMSNHGGFRGMAKGSHETKAYPNIQFAYTSCKLRLASRSSRIIRSNFFGTVSMN